MALSDEQKKKIVEYLRLGKSNQELLDESNAADRARMAAQLNAGDPSLALEALSKVTAEPARRAAYSALGGQEMTGTPSGEQIVSQVESNLGTQLPEEMPNLGTGVVGTIAALLNANKISPKQAAGFMTEQGLDPLVLVGALPEKTLAKVAGAMSGVTGSVKAKTGAKAAAASKTYDRYSMPEGVKIGDSHLPEADIGRVSAVNYRLNNVDDIRYAVKDNEVVGHVGVDAEGSVKTVYVDPKHRRKGVAEQLYKDYAKENGSLISDDFNAMEPEAKKLWEKLKKENPDKVNITDDGRYELLAGGTGIVGANTVLKGSQAGKIVNEENGYAHGGLVKSSLARIRAQKYAEGGLVSPSTDISQLSDEELLAEARAIEAEQATMPANPDATPVDGYTPMSEAELDALAQEVQIYGDRAAETAGITFLGGISAGIIPRIAQAAGLYKEDEIAKMQEHSPYSTTVADVGSVIAPALLTGGASLGMSAARKGIQTAAKATAAGIAESGGLAAERVVTDLLAKTANKTLNKEIVRKSVQLATRGAAEGAIYNVAHLANEDAIGKAQFNGENLLSHAVSGALGGGIIMGALPGMGAIGKAGARGGKVIFDKTLTKVADPVKDAFRLMGITPVKMGKLSDEYKKNFLPWMAKRVNPEKFADDEKLLEEFRRIRDAGEGIADASLNKVSADVGSQPGLVARGKQIWEDALRLIDDAMEKEVRGGAEKNSATYASMSKMREQVLDRLNSGKAFSPKDYREIRQGYDLKSKWNSVDAPPVQDLARDLRTLTNNGMHDLVRTIDPVEAVKVKQAFEDMRYTIDLIDSLENKLNKAQPGFISGKFQDLLQIAGLFTIGGGPLGAIGAAEAFLRTDFKRRMVVMRAIKKANLETEKLTKSSIEHFLSNAKPGRKAGTVSALMAAQIARPESNEKPKNKQEAYTNTLNNLNKFMTEPEKLMDKVAKATSTISYAAPKTAQVASERMINGVQFLAAKIPKSPYLESMPGLKKKEYNPSSMELAKFERYMQVIELPLTVLSELQNGTLTRDHVEALQAVYPEMYNYIRNSMYNKLQTEEGLNLPYQKRVQMGILMDITTDASMLGHNIGALQQNFKVTEQPEGGSVPVQGAAPVVNPTQGGAENLSVAKREATDTQAFLARRQEA